MDVGKSQRVPPFSFFRHCEIFSENKNFSPFNFLMFCDRMDVEKPQRVPSFSFSALWDFYSKICFFSKGIPLQLRQKCWQFRKCPPFSAPGARASGPRRATRSIFWVIFSKNFRFSSTVKEYLTLGSLFAIFEPWIWRRLGPFPACFQKQSFILSCSSNNWSFESQALDAIENTNGALFDLV